VNSILSIDLIDNHVVLDGKPNHRMVEKKQSIERIVSQGLIVVKGNLINKIYPLVEIEMDDEMIPLLFNYLKFDL
jgi:hypothetical protein